MMRQAILAVPLAFLLLAGVRADKSAGEEVAREGHSQQYHYNSIPVGGHDPYGLTVDLNTGLFMAVGGVLVLLTLAAICYPLLTKGTGYDYGYAGTQYGTYRSLNLASLSEKALSGIEKLYDVYNKIQ